MEIILDGMTCKVEKDTTILQACQSAGIDIPTLCHDDRLNPSGSCRLCLVEIEGAKGLVTACSTIVRDKMIVNTRNEKIDSARRGNLDLLISNHPLECLNCDKSGQCKLQDYCYEYKIEEGSYKGDVRTPRIDDSNHFYDYDASKCILCGLCVRVCSELQGTDAIGFENRGFDAIVTTPFNEGLGKSTCVSCGNCVSVCPTGALRPKSKTKFRHWEAEAIRTTCSYCGVGCQMDLLVNKDKVVGVQPAFDTFNKGLLCVKGKFGYNFISHPDRLKTPLIKRNGKFEEATWEEAYKLIKEKIVDIKKDKGPEAFAGLSSARCTNEENYLFQKLFRGVIGTNNVDHCARL